jgi:O-antigen/teichoic acid export membrane protein
MKKSINFDIALSNIKKLLLPAKIYGIFLSGNLLSFIIKFLSAFLLTKFALPEMLGAFNSQGLILSYGVIALIGVQDGLARELPYYSGQGKITEMKQIASTAQFWAILTGSIFSIILLIFGLVNIFNQKYETGIAWFSYSFNAFVLFYGLNYLSVTFRTRGDFEKLALSDVISNIVSFGSTFFILIFGYYGLCLRLFLTDISKLFFLFRWRPIKVYPKFDKNDFKLLINIGFPIYFTSQIYVWWGVLNLTLILLLLDSREFGIYQLAIIVGSTSELIISSITQIIYPKLTHDYGQFGSAEKIQRPLFTVILILFLVTSLIALIGWFLVPDLVTFILPNYVLGINAARWALISVIPLSITPIIRFFFVLKKLRIYLICTLSGMTAYLVYLLRVGEIELMTFPIALFFGRIVFAVIVIVFYILIMKKLNENPLFGRISK